MLKNPRCRRLVVLQRGRGLRAVEERTARIHEEKSVDGWLVDELLVKALHGEVPHVVPGELRLRTREEIDGRPKAPRREETAGARRLPGDRDGGLAEAPRSIRARAETAGGGSID